MEKKLVSEMAKIIADQVTKESKRSGVPLKTKVELNPGSIGKKTAIVQIAMLFIFVSISATFFLFGVYAFFLVFPVIIFLNSIQAYLCSWFLKDVCLFTEPVVTDKKEN